MKGKRKTAARMSPTTKLQAEVRLLRRAIDALRAELTCMDESMAGAIRDLRGGLWLLKGGPADRGEMDRAAAIAAQNKQLRDAYTVYDATGDDYS